MKIFVFLFLLYVANYSKQELFELTPEQKAIRDECAVIEKVDPALVAKAIEEMQYPEDKNFKCFLKCTLVKSEGMTESGELLVDNLKNQKFPVLITQDQASKMMDTCKEAKGADACETAYVFSKCVAQQVVKIFTV